MHACLLSSALTRSIFPFPKYLSRFYHCCYYYSCYYFPSHHCYYLTHCIIAIPAAAVEQSCPQSPPHPYSLCNIDQILPPLSSPLCVSSREDFPPAEIADELLSTIHSAGMSALLGDVLQHIWFSGFRECRTKKARDCRDEQVTEALTARWSGKLW